MPAVPFRRGAPLVAGALMLTAVSGCGSEPTVAPPDAATSVDVPPVDTPLVDLGSAMDTPAVDTGALVDRPTAMDRPAMDVASLVDVAPSVDRPPLDAPVSAADGAVVGLPGVMCGGDRCAPGERCCNQFTSRACQARSSVCPLVPTDCDGPEDCDTGQICCVGPNAEMRISAQCITGAACPGEGPTMSLMTCHTDAECAARGVGTPRCCPFAGAPPLLEIRWCRASCD